MDTNAGLVNLEEGELSCSGDTRTDMHKSSSEAPSPLPPKQGSEPTHASSIS